MKIQKTVAAALAMFATASVCHAQTLVIKGSDTLGAKLVPQLAEAFKASHPGANFKIAAEGSSTGISALIDKKTDIAMSSRHATLAEISDGKSKGVDMHPT